MISYFVIKLKQILHHAVHEQIKSSIACSRQGLYLYKNRLSLSLKKIASQKNHKAGRKIGTEESGQKFSGDDLIDGYETIFLASRRQSRPNYAYRIRRDTRAYASPTARRDVNSLGKKRISRSSRAYMKMENRLGHFIPVERIG